MTVLIALYVVGVIASMVYRHRKRYGPTAAIFVDAFWPLWMPFCLINDVKKRRARKDAAP